VRALDRRSAVLWAGLFVATLLLGGWPRPWVRAGFSRAYATIANPVLGTLTFGQGGHASLAPEGKTAVSGAAIEQDARLSLTVDGFEGELPFGLSLRRDAYLPCLLLIALLAGAPLAARRKVLCLAVGTGAVLVLSLVCVALTAAWLFHTQLQGVYQRGTMGGWALDVMAGTLLLPPSNRFVLPLALGAVLVLRSWRPTWPRLQSPPPPPAPGGSGSPPREECGTLPASARQ